MLMPGMFEVYQIGMKKNLELVSFDIDPGKKFRRNDKIASLDLKEWEIV